MEKKGKQKAMEVAGSEEENERKPSGSNKKVLKEKFTN
jgi:hypothetical protein